MDNVSIVIRFSDGTIDTINAKAFSLITFNGDLSDPDVEVAGIPNSEWVYLKSVEAIGRRISLMVSEDDELSEHGKALELIGMLITKAYDKSIELIVEANKEMRKKQGDA